MTTPAAASAAVVNTGPASTDPAVTQTGNPIPQDQAPAQTPEQIKAAADAAAAVKQKEADDAAAAEAQKEIDASWEYSGEESIDAAIDLMKGAGLKGLDAQLIFGASLTTGDLSVVNLAALEAKVGKKTATAVMALARAAVANAATKRQALDKAAAAAAGGADQYKTLVTWAHAKEKVDPAFKKELDDIRDLVNAGGKKTAIGVKELMALYAADPTTKGLNNALVKPDKAGAASVGTPLNRVDFYKEEQKVMNNRSLTPKAREDALADLRLRRAAGRKANI